MDQEKIGNFIAKLRKEKKWTQEDLARKMSTTRETISKWERGVYLPNTEYLLQLQDLFNVSINEILYGERKNIENKNDVNNITIKVIDHMNKKRKRIVIFSFSVIVILIFLILALYFINNYDSIRVYEVYGGNNEIIVSKGLMIYSNDKGYIKLGNIENNTSKKIVGVKFYFENGETDKLIFEVPNDETSFLITSNFKSDNQFGYGDISSIISNSFLDVTFDDNSVIKIKMNFHKDFSNTNIFSTNAFDEDKEEQTQNSNVPKFVIDNFDYDSDVNEYYLKTKINNTTVERLYVVETNLYVVFERKDNSVEKYERFIYDNSLMYSKFENDNLINTFVYEIDNNKCVNNNCDVNIVEHYVKQYLNEF